MKDSIIKITKNLLVCLLIIITLQVNSLSAQECNDRYLTLVNPVRGRNLWHDKTLGPIKDQYQIIKKENFPATWLIQHDVLTDEELLKEIKQFDNRQEIGVLLEISPSLATHSRVLYPNDVAWFEPQAIFLSGYSKSERKKLIDFLFSDFKEKMGFFPKSVGAWWIDSYTLNYIQKKYQVKSVMIVADQKTTDSYGVWGQWWGYPYYPSKINPLVPASSEKNKLDTVIIQWAQRDPVRAYGEGPKISNFSLQANDYIRQVLGTSYFKTITNVYLDCKNPLGQITVGLETGIESVGFSSEYKNQINYLKSVLNLNVVTMSDFSDKYHKVFPKLPREVIIGEGEDKWVLTLKGRSNQKLKDNIRYKETIAFSDSFVADKNKFLNRRLNELPDLKSNKSLPYFFLIIFIFGLFAFFIKKLKFFLLSVLFLIAAYGLVFRSFYMDGWKIFFGPVVDNLELLQITLTLFSIILIWLISKKVKTFTTLLFIPLSFGLDYVLEIVRASYISQKYYLGVSLDSLRFVGVSFQKPFNLSIVNLDLPAYQAAALLRFDFSKIWDNLWLWILVYPLVHILLGLLFGFIISKLPVKLQKITIILFSVLLTFHLLNIFLKDPRIAVPNI